MINMGLSKMKELSNYNNKWANEPDTNISYKRAISDL